MNTTGKVVHNDAICSLPINEHTGNEACLLWEEKEGEIVQTAHYTQGPQGNQVADYRADYLARYGPCPSGSLGSPEIPDTRDNRDPEEVGTAVLSERETLRHRNGSKTFDSKALDPGYVDERRAY